jgi:hypothetical protein
MADDYVDLMCALMWFVVLFLIKLAKEVTNTAYSPEPVRLWRNHTGVMAQEYDLKRHSKCTELLVRLIEGERVSLISSTDQSLGKIQQYDSATNLWTLATLAGHLGCPGSAVSQ